MRFDILTLFPGFFTSPLEQSILGKAITKGLLKVNTVNIRDFALDRHRTTDDYPYGGGHGMVMKVEPVVRALESLRDPGGPRPKVVLMTPQGKPFSHRMAEELAAFGHLAIICGRYEGVDERIREYADIELSVGDYILTGGETAALVVIDAVGRLKPGVLGEDASAKNDSFSNWLLEYPQYTRPEEYEGLKVPEVLVSGNHGEIEKWRKAQSLIRTYDRRPDLLENAGLTDAEAAIIEEYKVAKN